MALLVSGTGSEPLNVSSMLCLPHRADTQAYGWRVGEWGGCAAHPVTGVLLSSPEFKDLGAHPRGAGASISALASPSAPGIYVCAQCGYELFSSRSKYAHSSPWPAFTETIHADSVAKHPEHNQPGALKVGGSNWGAVRRCQPGGS